jgi:hypothetical protein
LLIFDLRKPSERSGSVDSVLGEILDHVVKVRLEQAVLHGAVFFELTFGVGFCRRRQLFENFE